MPELTDGLVTIRSPLPEDAATLIAGRDEEFHRWLGEGAARPEPVACILVASEIVGWVDYDVERSWLEPGEVNVGYNVFAAHRRKGYATRAIDLLLRHLADDPDVTIATLLIDPRNTASLAVARSVGFTPRDDLDGQRYFARPVRG